MNHTDRANRTDHAALTGGIALCLLVPALLLWQSALASKGEPPPDDTPYKIDQYGNNATECLYLGHSQVLPLYAEFALERDRNPKNFAAWLDYLQKRQGEQCFIHWGLSRLAAWRGDAALTKQELQKAWRLAASPEEREILAEVMQEMGK